MNTKKGKILKSFWFKSEREHREFVESIKNNQEEIVLNILKRMLRDGDLDG